MVPFHAYGPSHMAVLIVLVVLVAGLIAVGRAPRARPAERRFRRAFAAFIVAVMVPFSVWSMLPGRWSVDSSLPLQLCDLAWISAVIALWSGWRWATAVTYYWGLTLTVQAFVTPTLSGPDFPSPQFMMFWSMHSLTVCAAAYLTWGVRERQDWRGYRVTVAITLGWAVVVFVFNELTGANYGFLNHKPSTASILTVLGAWPWYLGVEAILALAVWAAITVPWTRGGKAGRQLSASRPR